MRFHVEVKSHDIWSGTIYNARVYAVRGDVWSVVGVLTMNREEWEAFHIEGAEVEHVKEFPTHSA